MLTWEEAETYLLQDGGKVPCSRYGRDSGSCAPVAYACYVIMVSETGEDNGVDSLDYMMGLVVNDYDDPEYLIRNYGAEYGFLPTDYLEEQEDV